MVDVWFRVAVEAPVKTVLTVVDPQRVDLPLPKIFSRLVRTWDWDPFSRFSISVVVSGVLGLFESLKTPSWMIEVPASEAPLSDVMVKAPKTETTSLPRRVEVMPSRPITIPMALMESPKGEENKEPFFFPVLGDRKKERKLKKEADLGM